MHSNLNRIPDLPHHVMTWFHPAHPTASPNATAVLCLGISFQWTDFPRSVHKYSPSSWIKWLALSSLLYISPRNYFCSWRDLLRSTKWRFQPVGIWCPNLLRFTWADLIWIAVPMVPERAFSTSARWKCRRLEQDLQAQPQRVEAKEPNGPKERCSHCVQGMWNSLFTNLWWLDPANPYKQVSLASVDIWGHEDALPRKPRLTLDLGEQHDEISAVLMELGVPLSLIPVDEDSSRLATSDLGTKALVKELRDKEEDLLRRQKFGEAQQLEENVQQLYGIGRELNELLRGKEDALRERPRNLIEIERLSQRISELEEKRLHVAALYDTDWWLTAMSLAVEHVEPIETESSPKPQLDRSSVAGSTHSTHHSHHSHPSHSSGHSENASAHSTQRPTAASVSPASPKSARNSMPRNFGRDQTQIAEALSTARSQP